MGRVTLTLPRLGETMEEARVTGWLVAPGTAFRRGDVLLEVETDKTVVEVPALADGTLMAQLVAEGETVALDQPIAEVEDMSTGAPPPHKAEGHRPAAAVPSLSKVEGQAQPANPGPLSRGGGRPARPAASPAARATARRLGADLTQVSGTGRNGRITRTDVTAANAAAGPVALHRTPGPGTPVMLLHGLFDDHRGWRDLQRRLATQGHAVIAADLPGHGDSAPTPTLDAATDALAAALPSGPVILVGHSLGAVIATRLARHLGPRAVRLILLAPAGIGPRINADFLDGMLNAATTAALARALAMLSAGPVSGPALASELARLHARRDGQRALADATARNGIQQTDITADLARLTCPVTVVFGTADRILNWQDVANLPARVAIHLIHGAGHLPHAVDPGLVADLIAGRATPAERTASA